MGMSKSPRFSRLDIIFMVLPTLLVLAFCSIYFVSKDFYLEWVLERTMRERQAVEVFTFGCSMTGSFLTGLAALTFLKRRKTDNTWGAFLIAGAVSGAAFFFAAEEVSWGQTWFGWETPEGMDSVETNLHNHQGMISVQMLGSIFLIAVFFVVPLVWRFNVPVKAPRDWKEAVPEFPVILCLAAAFLVSEVKEVYRWFTPDFRTEPFYIEFIEQFNEYKEMLVGVTLLMYGVYRIRRARGLGREVRVDDDQSAT